MASKSKGTFWVNIFCEFFPFKIVFSLKFFAQDTWKRRTLSILSWKVSECYVFCPVCDAQVGAWYMCAHTVNRNNYEKLIFSSKTVTILPVSLTSAKHLPLQGCFSDYLMERQSSWLRATCSKRNAEAIFRLEHLYQKWFCRDPSWSPLSMRNLFMLEAMLCWHWR